MVLEGEEVMKKFLCILFLISILIILGVFISIRYYLIDFFKPTFSLNLNINIEDIHDISIVGTPPKMENADQGYGTYLNIEKKKKIYNYLESIQLVENTEFVSRSPCCAIYFNNYELETVKIIYIYGSTFISESDSDKIYRVKYESIDIISGLEQLNL